ncbi:MAG: hypothetical protein SAMD01599839_06850 [Rectinema sp.]
MLELQTFYAVAFILAIPVFILSFIMPDDWTKESGVKKLTLKGFGLSLLNFIRNRRLFGTALVEMATYFSYGAFETYLPLYLRGKGFPSFGGPLIIGVVIQASSMATGFLVAQYALPVRRSSSSSVSKR